MYYSKAYYYGTGRRKHSVARVRVYPGSGTITINGRSIDDYFGLETLKLIVRQPLTLTDTIEKFDIVATVAGGGTGAHVEFLLLKRLSLTEWETLVHPGKRLKPGTIVDFPEGLSAEILDIVNEGNRLVRFSFEGDFFDILDRIGQMPLPPYITEKLQDKDRYNTIYCRETGSALDSALPNCSIM